MYLKSRFLGLFLLFFGVAQAPFLHASIIVNEGFGGPTFACGPLTIINTDYYADDTGWCLEENPYTYAVSPYSTAMSLDVILVTPKLAPNLPLTDITDATNDAAAFDGVNLWAGGTIQDVSGASISVGTDASGKIDQWVIDVEGAGPLAGWQLESSWNGSSGPTVISDGLLAENLNDPGSWSEVAATPEPSSGVDLALGLLTLGAIAFGRHRVRTARA